MLRLLGDPHKQLWHRKSGGNRQSLFPSNPALDSSTSENYMYVSHIVFYLLPPRLVMKFYKQIWYMDMVISPSDEHVMHVWDTVYPTSFDLDDQRVQDNTRTFVEPEDSELSHKQATSGETVSNTEPGKYTRVQLTVVSGDMRPTVSDEFVLAVLEHKYGKSDALSNCIQNLSIFSGEHFGSQDYYETKQYLSYREEGVPTYVWTGRYDHDSIPTWVGVNVLGESTPLRFDQLQSPTSPCLEHGSLTAALDIFMALY